MNNQQLTTEDIRRRAPSIFADSPWQGQGEAAGVSSRYRFISTAAVLDNMNAAGFYPVSATQSRTRIPGKGEYTKHLIRLRLAGQDAPQLNEVIPEVVLTNSHDGSAAYRLMLGLFRLVCLNGLTVASATFADIRIRHAGTPQEVTGRSMDIIGQAPRIMATVGAWQYKTLDRSRQLEFAAAAVALNGSSLSIQPERLLYARRIADLTAPENRYNVQADTAPRSLWKTYNVIQENLIKGGVYGVTHRNRAQHTRAVASVDRNIALNRGLWQLAEQFNQN